MMFSPSMVISTGDAAMCQPASNNSNQSMDEGIMPDKSRQHLAARLKLQQRRNQLLQSANISNNSSSSTVNSSTAAESAEDLQGTAIRMLSIKNRSAELAAEWLSANYQASEGAHVARENIFQEYTAYCTQTDAPALNSASFGKVIRSVFPSITTRRLGTRGNSKYHYYGVRSIRGGGGLSESTSTIASNSTGSVQRSDIHQSLEKASNKASPRPRKAAIEASQNHLMMGNIGIPPHGLAVSMPGPVPAQVNRPEPTEELIQDLLRLPMPDLTKMPNHERVSEFLQMYRRHCAELLRFGLQGEFNNFAAAIHRFWTLFPEYFQPVIESRDMCRLIADWDAMVYQGMLTIFLPDILSPGDKIMLRELRNFTKQFQNLAYTAFENKPDFLFMEKARVASDFSKIIKQYYHLNHFAVSANSVTAHEELLDKMLSVWKSLDFEAIAAQAVYVCPNGVEAVRLVQDNVAHRLTSQANITQWAEWVYAITEDFLPSDMSNYDEFAYYSQQYIVRWSYISSLILRDICEANRELFPSFHIIRLFCDEYVKYLVDCKLDEKRRQLDASGQWQPTANVNPTMTPVQMGFVEGAGLFNPVAYQESQGPMQVPFQSSSVQFLDQQQQHHQHGILQRSDSAASIKSMSIENVITQDDQQSLITRSASNRQAATANHPAV